MKIEIVYANRHRQAIVAVEVDDNTTIEAAIRKSGILRQFPDIDLAQQKVGIFGRSKPLDTVIRRGDRIEIYRAVVKRQANDEDDEA